MLSSRVFNRKLLSPRTISWPALLVFALAAPVFAAPVRRALPVPSSSVAVPPAGPRAFQFQILQLERSSQDLLLLRAKINGKRALLCVDSGAPFSVIATHRLAHFGLTSVLPNSELPTHVRVNGSYNVVAVTRSLQLGALNLINEPMVAVNLGNLSRTAKNDEGEPIDGILGADILFPTQAVLDCRAQTLTLKIDPTVNGGVPGLDYRGYARVPMHVSAGNNLYVDGRFNGRRAKLMVDTGAFSTLFHQSFISRMKIPLRESDIVSEGLNMEQRDIHFATISRFSVGSVHMRNKKVGVTNLGGLVRGGLHEESSPPVAGLLGSEILQRHNAIIDFGTKTLYLKR